MNLMAALWDCGLSSCVRKTAESSAPPRYCRSRNRLSITCPSDCVQISLMVHLPLRVLVSPLMQTRPTAWRDRRKSTVASKAGLERLELRFAGARGRALVTHILARNRLERERRSYRLASG